MTDYTPPPTSDQEAVTASTLVVIAQATQALVNMIEALRQYSADTDAAAAEFTEIINTTKKG
jgi:hypothetical protein